MKRLALMLFAISSVAMAGAAMAQTDAPATPVADASALIKSKHCFVCHDEKMHKIGPAFRDVSRRYRGLKNAKERLVRIIHGGSDTPTAVYHWGDTTMPPESVRIPVSDAEAAILADYILQLK